jgi:hypothetical protein
MPRGVRDIPRRLAYPGIDALQLVIQHGAGRWIVTPRQLRVHSMSNQILSREKT